MISSIGSIRNRTDKGEYIISGNLINPNLNRLESEISYLNRDRYEGFVDINNNTIIRTEGKILEYDRSIYICKRGDTSGIFLR